MGIRRIIQNADSVYSRGTYSASLRRVYAGDIRKSPNVLSGELHVLEDSKVIGFLTHENYGKNEIKGAGITNESPRIILGYVSKGKTELLEVELHNLVSPVFSVIYPGNSRLKSHWFPTYSSKENSFVDDILSDFREFEKSYDNTNTFDGSIEDKKLGILSRLSSIEPDKLIREIKIIRNGLNARMKYVEQNDVSLEMAVSDEKESRSSINLEKMVDS